MTVRAASKGFSLVGWKRSLVDHCRAKVWPLVAVFAGLLSMAAISWTQPAQAQSLPSSCKPNSGGTQDCAAKIPGPWVFLNASCSASLYKESEAESQALWESQYKASYTACPGALYNRIGWIPQSAPMCVGGFCGSQYVTVSTACGGSPLVYPSVAANGDEVGNWLVYEVGGVQGSPPSCTPRSVYDIGEVRRTRPEYCPRGYTQSGSYCYRSGVDVAKAVGSQCPACGNPIAPGSGNKFQKEVDYVGGGDYPLRFERYYNSLLRLKNNDNGHYGAADHFTRFGNDSFLRLASGQGRIGFNAPAGSADRREALFWSNLGLDAIGGNWRHTYQRSIRFVPNTSAGVTTAFAYRHDGRVISFVGYSGAFVAQADVADKLVALMAGGWEYTIDDSGEVETYNADGQLQSIRSRSGQTHTLQYDTDGRLTTVTDSFGRQLALTYGLPAGDASAVLRVESVTDPAGNAIQYSYGANATLTGVTYPGAQSKQYQYTNATYLRGLTGIVDESAQQYATFGYDASGQANLSEHAGGAEHVGLTYVDTADTTTGNATVVDAAGASRTYAFSNVLGIPRVTSLTQPAASGTGTVSATSTYDANGNRTGYRDFNGFRSCYTYNTTRNLETQRVEGLTGTTCPGTAVSGVTRTTTTSWHSTQKLPLQIAVYAGATATGTPLRQTTFAYDSAGNQLTRTITDLTVTPNASRTWTYTYNGYGKVLTVDGPRTDVSDVTTYTYYACSTGYQCGQVNAVTNALGHVTTYNTYNAHGLPLTITDPNSVVTTLTYDARRRLTSRTVGSELTSFEYWPTGLLKKVTLPDSSFLAYTYDAAHRLTRIDDTDGNYVAYTLDAMSNRTAESAYDPSSALSRTQTRVYNTLNQLWKEIGAAGTTAVTTQFAYDNNGNQTNANAPLSRNAVNTYDELNRLKQITDPGSGLTRFTYDANDNLLTVLDPRNLQTSYTYTAFGDLLTQLSPDTGTTTNTYDSGGNLQTSTNARSAVTTYAYDALNRATSAQFKIGTTVDQTIAYTYDSGTNGAGRLTGASDANHSLTYTYDAQGRVTGKGQTVSGTAKTVSYGYTNANLTSMTTPSGQSITYGYTSGRPTSISVNGTTLLSGVLYEPMGPVRQWTWGNSTLAVRSHDQDGRVSQIDSSEFSTYAYDDASRVTTLTNTGNSALSWTYGYDVLDRLTSGARTGLSQTWTYDANGNRLTQGGTTSTTFTNSGTSNRLSSTSGALTRTYGYDATGNTTGYSGLTFTYNYAGRMTGVSGGASASYLHNALGQRVKKVTGGNTTYFVYDEAGHLLGEYTSAGALIQETVWLDDIPVATLRPNGASVDIYYIHTDHLNSPRKVTRPSDNALRWRWDPDAFGNGAANENPQSIGTFVYNLRFPGQYYDTETGLNYNYFRDYDSQTGRYVQSDPIGLAGGINTYAYVGGNPISTIDPMGSQAIPLPFPGFLPPVAIPGSSENQQFGKSFGAFLKRAGEVIEEICKTPCPPCTPYAAGTIGYLGPHNGNHFSKIHQRFLNPHLNLFIVRQNRDCKCFWNDNSPMDSAEPPPHPDWINLNNGFPPLSP
ncbi:MAG: RHS repeat-associated core domain-containing protein [Steroidobacteraceae bacterium]